MADHPLEEAVLTALAHNVLIHADQIVVQVIDGRATLRGTVRTFPERAEAVCTARDVPGIDCVDDDLQEAAVLSRAHRDAAIEAAERVPGVVHVHGQLQLRERAS
jgi:osmotically-inducible protein OsmY